MRVIGQVGMTVLQILWLVIAGAAVCYFVFVLDWNSQPLGGKPVASPPVAAPAKTVEQRLKELERGAADFQRQYKATLDHAENSSWYSEKILRLITVISILGTLFTTFGYFSLSRLKERIDEFEKAREGYDKLRSQTETVGKRIVDEGNRLGLPTVLASPSLYVDPQPVSPALEYYDIAVTAWDLYTKLDWQVYDMLGRYFLATEQYPKALYRFSIAIERNSAAYSAMYLSGYCLCFMARTLKVKAERQDLRKQAERLFTRARKGEPKNPYFCLGLGWMFDEKKDYDTAIEWYKLALKYDQGLVEATFNIACSQSKNGNPAEAFATLNAMDRDTRKRLLADESDLKKELGAVKDWDAQKYDSLFQ